MIGDMISRIRKEKDISKANISKLTKINIGHLTHIEKGERNPSHKALKNICKALEIPYQPLMYTYDKSINEDQEFYKAINHISYNRVLAVDSLDSFIDCPASAAGASIAIKINDASMEPKIKQGSYAFVEFNTPLDNKDVGLIWYDNKVLVRRFIIRRDKLVLRADNKDFSEIDLSEKDDFYIIGKIVGTNLDQIT